MREVGRMVHAHLVLPLNYLPGSKQFRVFLRQIYLLKYVTTISPYLFQKLVLSSLEPMWAFSTSSKLRLEQTLQAHVNHHLIWGSQCFPNSHSFPKEKGIKTRKLKTQSNKKFDTQEREQEVYFDFWLFLKEGTNAPSIFLFSKF